MNLVGAFRLILTSPISRAVALAVALMLAFACLADAAHAVGGDPDGCEPTKLEAKRSLASFVDFAVLPSRFEPTEPAMLASVVDAGRSSITSFVFARHGAPRGPPVA